MSRYIRQSRFAPLGDEGQARLAAGRVLLCGCGALGSVIANTLARAGVGKLRIVDRDFLELNNLQRQVLYTEEDVQSGLPKAIAAANRLRQINSEIKIEPLVADVSAENIETLLDGVDLILDGTDNFETRMLLNDAALKFRLPWIFGGCIGAEGQTMTVVPGETPCLRCVMPEIPPPGSTPTCDIAGILGPAVHVVASLQACEAIKILSGNRGAINRRLTVFDLWQNTVRQVKLDALANNANCPACTGAEYPWLSGERGSHTAVLCGRNAVQLSFPDRESLDLPRLAEKLQAFGPVTHNEYLVRAALESHTLTLFADGRAIIAGTGDPAVARSVYARFVGN